MLASGLLPGRGGADVDTLAALAAQPGRVHAPANPLSGTAAALAAARATAALTAAVLTAAAQAAAALT